MDLVETPTQPSEHRHPWESVRAEFFLRVLREAKLLRPDVSTLDVGAGDAWLAARFATEARASTVTCWDDAYEARPAVTAPHPAIRFVASPSPGERYDLALLLDVLEHVEDDAGFLTTIVGDQLLPGAHVLASFPAWSALYSAHDRLLRHRRRYDPSAARALVEGAGLRIERSGGLFHSLLLPRALQLAGERLGVASAPPDHAGQWRHGRFLTTLVATALRADALVSRAASRASVELPGLSWWALCRRPF